MDSPEKPIGPDEVNRLWQHGMHEERLFHDRLNYFSAIQVGLLGVFAILYHKEPAPGVFAPLTAVGLAFTLLWLRVQVRHWRYCVHVNDQIKRIVPEYGRTLAGFAAPGRVPRVDLTGAASFRRAGPAPVGSRAGWRTATGRLRPSRWRRFSGPGTR